MTLTGRIALVTGAARGQGRAHARALASAGADVVLLDSCAPVVTTPFDAPGRSDLDETAEIVRALGRRATVIEVDARDLASMMSAVKVAEEDLGPLDIAVVNHGIWSRSPLHEMSEEMWDEMIDVNLSSMWKVLRVVAPGMIARRRGAIVMTSSIAGTTGIPGSAHYAAAKHGVLGLMKTAALELGPYGIRVNAVCPGIVDTAMVDFQACYDMAVGHEGGTREDFEKAAQHNNLTGGMARTDEISAAVTWLVSDAASQVTGHALPVDGGHLVLPGFNHGPFLLPTSRGDRI